MDTHQDHGEWVKGFFVEQQMIFDTSSQAMYAYLDDDCRACNQKFATLLGYDSPEEWASVNVDGMFPRAFVAEKSQKDLVGAYQKAMKEMAASMINVSWKKKSGDTVDTTVILAPIAYKGHVFALHFVNE
jgi:hypothetical protein